jgi:hypothetical protein
VAALGFPTFLIATDPAAVSPSIVSLIGLLFICAGTLSSPSRGQSRSSGKDRRHDDRDNEDPEEGSPIDPMVREIRKVARRFMDGTDDSRMVAAL